MSTLVSIVSDQPVTSTLVIAQHTDNQHKNVLSMVRQYKADLEGFGVVAFETRKLSGAGRPEELAHLNERQATLLISFMRNSPVVREFKVRLVKAFYELAEQPATAIPTNLVEALRLAADKAEEAEKLALKVERDAPKVQFHDKVAMAEDACTVAEAAKLIGTGRNRLFTRLRQIGWLTRKNEPYQQVISSGLMDVKIGKWEHPEQGLKESITPLITGKGLSKLQSLYQEQMALV